MKIISFPEFLKELQAFYSSTNTKSDVMVLQHPLHNCGPELEKNEYWYLIPGNCHDYISDDTEYEILISDKFMANYANDQLKINAKELYNKSNTAIIRCIGNECIQLYHNYDNKDGIKYIINLFTDEYYKMRKLTVVPFEVKNITIREIYTDPIRANDKIEDTSTKIEYISFGELQNRIKQLYNIIL